MGDKVQHELAKSRKHAMTLSAAVAVAKEESSDLQSRLNETEKVTNATKARMTYQANHLQQKHDGLASQAEKEDAEANHTAHALSEARNATNALKKALADKEHDQHLLINTAEQALHDEKKELKKAK